MSMLFMLHESYMFAIVMFHESSYQKTRYQIGWISGLAAARSNTKYPDMLNLLSGQKSGRVHDRKTDIDIRTGLQLNLISGQIPDIRSIPL